MRSGALNFYVSPTGGAYKYFATYDTGSAGYYWSKYANTPYALSYFFNFGASSVNSSVTGATNGAMNRFTGFSLRCLAR